MQLRQLTLWAILGLAIAGCSSGDGKGGTAVGPIENPINQPPIKKPELDCNTVLTDEKIKNFNHKYKQFFLKSSGAYVYCMHKTEVNGQVTKTEVSGSSQVNIYPNLALLRVEVDKNNFVLTLAPEPMIEAYAKAISFELDFPFVSGAYPNYVFNNNDRPSFIRFGKGALFYLTEQGSVEVGGITQYPMKITADDDQKGNLANLMQKHITSNLPFEIIWQPWKGEMAVQPSSAGAVVWSALSAEDVVVSMVRDNEFSSSAVMQRAIGHIRNWNLEISSIHKKLPEVYQFAIEEWQNPNFSGITVSTLLEELEYIIKVEPNSSLKPVLDAHYIINKYNFSNAESLNIAYDYVNGKLWTKQQFDLMVDTAEIVFEGFGRHSWEISQEILKKSSFDKTSSQLIATIANILKKNNLGGGLSVTSFLDYANSKLTLGLNANNVSYYVSTMTYLKDKVNASSAEAEQFCDSLVLSGKINASNQASYFDFMSWLKSEFYFSFSDIKNALANMTNNSPLTSAQVDLFRQVFTYLYDSINLTKSVAITKTASFFKGGNFDASKLNAFKTLLNWLYNDISVVKNVAVEKAEKIVLSYNASEAQVDLVKSYVNWLYNELSVVKNLAVDKGENYFIKGVLTQDSYRIIKKLVNYLYNDISLIKNEAIDKAEKIVFDQNYNESQVDLMISAIKWLYDDLSLYKSEAVAKGIKYITDGKLNLSSFNQLKLEYDNLTNLNKNKQEALAGAEKKVLNL